MKHISIALCLCGMILMNTSCDNYDDTYPQEYEKILSLQTTGEQAVDLYKTGEATNYSITVIKSGSQPTLTASAHIGAMDAVNFEKYISERGLDYVAMPANCYSFNMEELDYSSAETYKIINLQLLSVHAARTHAGPGVAGDFIDVLKRDKRVSFQSC